MLAALNETNSSYGVAINSIAARGGTILEKHFGVLSGSPFRLKSHLGHDTVLKNLIKIRALHESEGVVYLNSDIPHGTTVRLDALLVVENILLQALKEWFRKTGLISYDSVEIRSDKDIPAFGQFSWDLTGPSYCQPFASHKEGETKPGFIVGDVCLNGTLNKRQVQYFVNKCSMTRPQKKMRPFMAFFVANSFEQEALIFGKAKGLIFTTPDILLGDGIGRSLAVLLETLCNAAAKAVTSPEVVGELMSALSKIEGAAGNLRGALFELLVGHYAKKTFVGNLDIGKAIVDSKSGKKGEIDVFLVGDKAELHCFECKGRPTSDEISGKEIKKWLNKKIPLIRNWIENDRKDLQNHEQHFHFWTTGSFSGEARVLLGKAQESTKYAIEYCGGEEVARLMKGLNNKRINEIMKEHFLKHPLAKS